MVRFNPYASRRIIPASGIKLMVFYLLISSLMLPLSDAWAASSNTESLKPFIAVLAYHHIIPGQLPRGVTSRAVIPLAEFEAQMDYLYDNGYYTASLKDVEDFIYLKKTLPEKTVLITFDDGYESNFVYAYPVLKKYNFRAALFLIGNTIVQKEEPFDSDRLSMLSFGQIKEMLDSGLVEFGSHSFNAHEYRGNKPALLSMDSKQTEEDFMREKELFAKNGLPYPSAIAYPYGRFNGKVLDATKRFGYTLGFTINDGFVYQNSNPYTLNRIIVPPGTDIPQFKMLLNDNLTGIPADFKNSIVLRLGSSTAYVKGRPLLMDSCAFIEKGSTMVPLRFIAQSLGARVDWISEENKIMVSTPEKTIEIWTKPFAIPDGDQGLLKDAANSLRQEAMVNGNRVLLDVPPAIRSGRVMVPLRFLSEALGFEVKWHEARKIVEIKD